jgi:hypothetical protein
MGSQYGFPFAHIECDFKVPSRMGDIINLTLLVERIGRSSLRIVIVCHQNGIERLCARINPGRTVIFTGDVMSFDFLFAGVLAFVATTSIIYLPHPVSVRCSFGVGRPLDPRSIFGRACSELARRAKQEGVRFSDHRQDPSAGCDRLWLIGADRLVQGSFRVTQRRRCLSRIRSGPLSPRSALRRVRSINSLAQGRADEGHLGHRVKHCSLCAAVHEGTGG